MVDVRPVQTGISRRREVRARLGVLNDLGRPERDTTGLTMRLVGAVYPIQTKQRTRCPCKGPS